MPLTPSGPDVRRRLKEGLDHLRAGRLDQAERIYRQILQENPRQSDALHLLGVVLHQRGDSWGALPFFEKAAAGSERHPDIYANWGLALKNVGWKMRAKAVLRRALELQHGHEEAMFNLGLLLCDEGDGPGAEALFRRLVRARPAAFELRLLLCRALELQGRAAEAREQLLVAADLNPRDPFFWIKLTEMTVAAGKPEEARQAAEEGLKIAPRNLELLALMAEAHLAAGDRAGAAEWMSRARAVDNHADDWFCAVGISQEDRNEIQEAARSLGRALAFNPANGKARWRLSRLLPPTYSGTAEVETVRGDYERNLDILERSIQETGPGAPGNFLGLASTTNFYLAYQERNDRDLQVRFGRIAAPVVQARFPEFTKRLPIPLLEPDGRIRVGFLSYFFYRHTVGRLFAGWMENMDRRRFKVVGYHIGLKEDNISKLLRARCDEFHRLPHPSADAFADTNANALTEWYRMVCRTVTDDRLHALVYPDIGMHPSSYCLAALRLAPVQAVGIGHPVTTGLETMDYFLSGELIEPEGAEAHYSEKLVRLPNISVRLFDPGPSPATAQRSRASFGFGPNEIIFLSTQSAYKYVPWYDRIFSAIAKRVPNARFAFVLYHSSAMDRSLLERLDRVFAAEGLKRDDHCYFIDKLPPGDFSNLNYAADVYLDTPGWSGGNTTHEAIAAGTPVVTLPGAFMRGRVGSGMLRMIGVEDTIARDVDDYVAIAVRLGLDGEYRRQIRAKVEANRHKLYNDEACVRGLEDFLLEAVAKARSETPG